MSAGSRTPWVTLLLIAANVAVAFALYFDPTYAELHGFRANDPTLATAVSSLFIHVNALHLMGNMVFLAAVGPYVEESVGPARFLVVYLVGGLVGVASHWALLAPLGSRVPLIGASGCIAACVGYASVRFFGRRVPLAPGVKSPVWAVALIWLALQVVAAFVRLGDDAPVAYWAHVGGFLGGLLMAAVFRASREAGLEQGRKALDAMEDRSAGATLAAADRHLEEHPDDLEALRRKSEAHGAFGDRTQEVATLQRMVEIAPEAELPGLVLRLGDLGALDSIDSYQRTMLAERLKATHPEAARALLASVVDGPASDGQRPDAMLSLAQLSPAEQARALLDALLSQYPLHPATEVARARGLLE